jgi:FkbM family methyltransferase
MYNGNFLERIIERKSILPKLVSEMNASGLPLLFFGTGASATALYKAVSRYNLRISDVVVSWSDQPLEFMGFKVQNILDALQKYEKCNIMIAFQNICKFQEMHDENSIEDYFMRTSKIGKIYYFDTNHSFFNQGEPGLNYEFVEKNQQTLNDLMRILADDLSRDTLAGFFNQRISGDIRYLNDLYINDQYFPDEIKFENNEVFIDCGAFDGDTIDTFIRKMEENDKKIAQIIAFEPDEENFNKLKVRNFENTMLFKKGVYDQKTTLSFSGTGNTRNAISDAGLFNIEVDTIEKTPPPPPIKFGGMFIKMDIEGAELAAIEGARNTIKTYKPKLAICVYHKNEDLITIPQKILSFVPEYKLYLRAHRPLTDEVVLYAVK